jgi:flagellar biosynthesis protein FlhF
MKIKKFTAKTFALALAQVRKELSEDAIILSSEEKKGLRPHVEVTAAIDFDAAEAPSVRSSQFGVRSGPQADSSELPVPDSLQPSRPSAAPSGAGVEELKAELSGLKTMLEGMKNSGYEMSLPAAKRAVVNFLTERSVRQEYALRLSDKTTDLSEIPLYLSADIRVKRSPLMRKAVMLIGPTGVGKTTTIAKLAAQAVKAGKKAAVINLDTYRIGAAEQARIYSRIIGIPLATATTTAEFRSNLIKFSESRDVVFIDTTGRNPRDESYIRALSELCTSDIPLETHLLMNANGDDECMIEAYRSYSRLPIDYIAFTKVDEAVRFGSLYNLILTYQKPVAYLTTGQRVPGDIESATVGRLAGLIVKKECSV